VIRGFVIARPFPAAENDRLRDEVTAASETGPLRPGWGGFVRTLRGGDAEARTRGVVRLQTL
jgi:hypothetical protein